MKPARRTDRRRLRRKLVRLPAVVYADGKAVQVVMRDQSDASLGFISPVGFAPGQQVYLKIGIGPGRLPVGVLVARCDREGEAFDIGGKIVGPEITDKP
ncbi:MAG: PilZ domain-containing protein [Phycisphaerae bacterium]